MKVGWWCVMSLCSYLISAQVSTEKTKVQLLEIPSYSYGLSCGNLAQAGVYKFQIMESLGAHLKGQTILVVIPCQTCLHTTTAYYLNLIPYSNGDYLVLNDYEQSHAPPIYWCNNYTPLRKRRRYRRFMGCCHRGKKQSHN